MNHEPDLGSGDNAGSIAQHGRPPAGAPPGEPSSSGVHGRVVRAGDAAPVAGAAIEVSPADPSVPAAALAAVTDEDGRYRWPLAPGRWRVRVSADGLETAVATVVVPMGAMVAADFRLSPSPARSRDEEGT